MKNHTILEERLDKKGNVVSEPVQPIRYVDLNTGVIYTQKEDGRLVSKDGRVYGEELPRTMAREELEEREL